MNVRYSKKLGGWFEDLTSGISNAAMNVQSGAESVSNILTPKTVTVKETPAWVIPAALGTAALVILLVMSKR